MGWGSLLGVDSIRQVLRWAIDHSTTYRIWLIPLLNRYCQPNRGFPGLLLKGVRILTQHNLYPQLYARAAYGRINPCFL